MHLSLDQCLAELSAYVLACTFSWRVSSRTQCIRTCLQLHLFICRLRARRQTAPDQPSPISFWNFESMDCLNSLLTCGPLWTRNKEATVCGDSISSQTLLTCPCYCFLFSNFRPRILGMPESGKFIVRVPVYRRKFLVISNLNHTFLFFYFFFFKFWLWHFELGLD